MKCAACGTDHEHWELHELTIAATGTPIHRSYYCGGCLRRTVEAVLKALPPSATQPSHA